MTLDDLIEDEKIHAARKAAKEAAEKATIKATKETEERAAAGTVLRMNARKFSVSDIAKATDLSEERIREIIREEKRHSAQ